MRLRTDEEVAVVAVPLRPAGDRSARTHRPAPRAELELAPE